MIQEKIIDLSCTSYIMFIIYHARKVWKIAYASKKKKSDAGLMLDILKILSKKMLAMFEVFNGPVSQTEV